MLIYWSLINEIVQQEKNVNTDDFLVSFFVDSIATNIKTSNLKTDFLSQNTPNPFTKSTLISYSIAEPCNVQMIIYNHIGQVVRILINEDKPTGKHNIIWNGTDEQGNKLSNGIYFYKIQAGSKVFARKMMYIK